MWHSKDGFASGEVKMAPIACEWRCKAILIVRLFREMFHGFVLLVELGQSGDLR